MLDRATAAALRAYHIDQAVARFTPGQVDALIRNVRDNAAYSLRMGDDVWRHSAPRADEMLAILHRLDQLELGGDGDGDVCR